MPLYHNSHNLKIQPEKTYDLNYWICPAPDCSFSRQRRIILIFVSSWYCSLAHFILS